MNKACNRSLFTRLPGKEISVHPAIGWIVGNSSGSRANNIYSPGNNKLTEVQLNISTSCQSGSRVIRALSTVDIKVFFLI